MPLIIREYRPSDFAAIAKRTDEFQHYLVELDRWDSIARPVDHYGERYTEELLQRVEREGKIFVAEEDSVIVGHIAGTLERPQAAVPDTSLRLWGRVLELFIADSHRGKGVGTQLMQTLEQHFRGSGCEAMVIEVFAPNTKAFEFYRKHGYDDWTRDVIKRL